MARAGQPLDPWQREGLDIMLGVRPDGKWACFEYAEWVPRQNGKGAILEARALAGLLLLGDELIMWSAHEYKTAMEAFRRVVGHLRRLGERVNDNLLDLDDIRIKVINTNGEEGVERLDTGQRLKFVARSKGSGRGFSGDLNIIDEAFPYTSEQQSALLPTMSARPNPQIVYASTPPLSGSSGDVMYALRLRGDPDAPRRDDDPPWTQDQALGYRDWGLAGDLDNLHAIDLDDESLWRAANPAMAVGRISVEYVARERRAMAATPADFARERLGIWPRWTGIGSAGWQVISESQWRSRLGKAIRLADPVAIGVDITPDRTWAAIAAAGVRPDGYGIEVVDHRPGEGWVVRRLKELAERHSPCVIVVSDRALFDRVPKDELPLILASPGNMASAASMMFDGVAGTAADVWHLGSVCCGETDCLSAAVSGATIRPLGDGWAWNRRSVSVDICPLVAASLALWGLKTPRLHAPNLKPFVLIGG